MAGRGHRVLDGAPARLGDARRRAPAAPGSRRRCSGAPRRGCAATSASAAQPPRPGQHQQRPGGPAAGRPGRPAPSRRTSAGPARPGPGPRSGRPRPARAGSRRVRAIGGHAVIEHRHGLTARTRGCGCPVTWVTLGIPRPRGGRDDDVRPVCRPPCRPSTSRSTRRAGPGIPLGNWRWVVRQRMGGVRDALVGEAAGSDDGWLAARGGAAFRERNALLSRLAHAGPQVLETPDVEATRIELKRLRRRHQPAHAAAQRPRLRRGRDGDRRLRVASAP